VDYFAGLDVSMDETHVCVLDPKGEVVRADAARLSSASSTPG
jgi:hypothetical protein